MAKRKFDTDDHRKHILEESICKNKDEFCNLCEDEVSFDSTTYECRKCTTHFHKDCLKITYPKIHEHTLTFLPRKNYFPCDLCGSIDSEDMNTFICVECNFIVHRNCIFLPKAIKITRHTHRLSLHLSGFDDNIQKYCGICQESLDRSCGGYSCVYDACDYVAHSYCATNKNVWDGKDVEGESDKYEVYDNSSYVEIENGNKIRHFSHDHDLTRFNEESNWISSFQCQACVLPIDFGTFFGCKQCEFALHETCARLPRLLEHLIHIHPLNLEIDNIKKGFFTCSTCNQDSCGFMYRCWNEDCEFKVDVKCATFVEPFYHFDHEYPIFLRQNAEFGECWGCHRDYTRRWAACKTCSIILELKCANLPRLVKYKYDSHPLTLSRSQWKNGVLCEICEEEILYETLFYTCRDCCAHLHVDCVLGKHLYMKGGHNIQVKGLEIQIASNHRVSRSICHTCHCLCQDKLIFKSRDVCFCSMECIGSYTKALENHSST